jgi:proprotein convertase subtilisin/kexin type 5
VCSAGYFRSGTSCVSSCNGSNYANVTTLSCAACDVKCATCQNSTNCSTCFGNQTMYNGYCYPSCAAVDPNLRVNQGVCMYCQTTICISCVPNTTSPYACTSCKNSLHFYNPTTYECTISCTLPYYADSLNKKCVPCDSSCATCDTSYKACQTCQGQLVAYQGNCSASCPVSYYNNNGIC